MSKDLEKEYKALMDSDVPDLWARIEAGIDEKKGSGNIQHFEHRTQNEKGKRNTKKPFHFKVWGTVAAACLCVAVAIPVMMQVTKDGTSDMKAMPEMAAESFDTGYAQQDDAAVKSADTDLLNNTLTDSVAVQEAENAVADVAEQAEANDTQRYSKELIRGWFDGTAEPEMEQDAEPLWTDDGVLYYLPVKDKNIYDLREFLAQYFDDDEIEELLNAEVGGYAPFMEVDGVLYHGVGMVGSDCE